MANTSDKGVVAIVGCGLGLGGAIAVKFAKEGFSIAAMARSQASLEHVKGLLSAVGSGVNHGFYVMDATKKEDVDAAFEKVALELGIVRVMVYNISDSPKALQTTVLDIKPEEYMDCFNRNAVGALLATQAVLPKMLASEGQLVSEHSKGYALSNASTTHVCLSLSRPSLSKQTTTLCAAWRGAASSPRARCCTLPRAPPFAAPASRR